MKTFKKHLNEKLKHGRFKKLYAEERQLAELAVEMEHEAHRKPMPG